MNPRSRCRGLTVLQGWILRMFVAAGLCGACAAQEMSIQDVRIWKAAAEAGEATSQCVLGLIYLHGSDALKRNPAEGLQWLHKAAAQDFALAEKQLGIVYCFGRGGVATNQVEAEKWLRRAAEQGDARSQQTLGELYRRGKGGLKLDLVQAFKWHSLAADQNKGDSKGVLAMLNEQLSAEQLSEGQRLAAAFVPRPSAAEKSASPNRLTVIVLPFENQTGDTNAAHWSFGIENLLMGNLGQIKALKVLENETVQYGFHELKKELGQAVNPKEARKLGEWVEARRVIWGTYHKTGRTWRAVARVLTAATGKVSPDIEASSENWFEVRDQLVASLLAELDVTPTEVERIKMSRRSTKLSLTLEAYVRGAAANLLKRPLAEVEEHISTAALDVFYAEAQAAMAATLANQGKLKEARELAELSVNRKLDYAENFTILGTIILAQGKVEDYEEAEEQLHQAMAFAPEEKEPYVRLAELRLMESRWSEAVSLFKTARRLAPLSASTRSGLARAYAYKGDRARAVAELKEAERLNTEDLNTEQMIALTYDRLGDKAAALEHFEKFVALAKIDGVQPEKVALLAKRAEELRKSLTPVPVKATAPKTYSEKELQEQLRNKLTAEELALVVNPLASQPEMKRWATELTSGAKGDLEKGQKLFEAMAHHIDPGEASSRTAQETFAAWHDAGASLRCQEYARLYVALARDAGLKAYFTIVRKDCYGDNVLHACAALFVNGKVFLVDPMWRWFGVPHQGFEVMDDFHAVVHHLDQLDDLPRVRIAAKLEPGSAIALFNLAEQLLKSEAHAKEARPVIEAALKLEPESALSKRAEAALAMYEGKEAEAIRYLRKAIVLESTDARTYLNLADILRKQENLAEASEDYRTFLRHSTKRDEADYARARIAEISEKLSGRAEKSKRK